MVTCHLTKLETALDNFRKSYPKLKPADAGLLASALTLTGRHALALYEGNQYRWPEDYDKLTHAMVAQLEMVQSGIEPVKKTAKTTVEEEPVVVTVGLAPNISAGEDLLEGRDDLKTLLSDVITDGVEFVYSGMDLGWQWALDRVNWNTISGGELSRRIKIKAAFTEGAVGLEMGTGPKKRSSRKVAAKDVKEEVKAEEPATATAVVEAPVAEAPAPAPAAKAEKKPAAAKAAAEKPVKEVAAKPAPKPVAAKPAKDEKKVEPKAKPVKVEAKKAAPAKEKAPAKAKAPVKATKQAAPAKAAKAAKVVAKTPAKKSGSSKATAKPAKKMPAKATKAAKPVKKAAAKPAKKAPVKKKK